MDDNLKKMLERYTPQALAVLRIVTALLFMQHGLQKLLLFPTPSEHGTPAAWTLVWYGGWIEAAGGALIAAGLFTRAIAFVASGEMAVGYFMVHAPVSIYPVLNHGDLAVLFCFVFLFFVFSGPGAWSLDGLLSKRSTAPRNAR
ncbi:DoxX family membrane protein [Duganella sp. FT135W]|uniref:DoxX family membrane protein n=1 Tax=Duganella flavida TaxID=2692175 RepID=A0A6L8KGQ7_9BURK|nr:DoxX family protein [Duganella flavida]MYM26295.1 DoxX family membrane protein [Duganella flavida]